ncbi:MAG: 50S ribosomal protein L35 [Tissierellia bacterium]|nr:50S ribosomal protein L35 [Tissierellia bacterium]
MSYKMKTHRGSAKRFKRTGSGKIRRYKAYKSHITGKKSPKRIRNLRKGTLVSAGDQRRIDQMIP